MKKIEKMVCYDKFLKDVIEQYSDEFEGPENVVARYKTLKESNERLKKSQRVQESLYEKMSEQTVTFEKDQTTKQVTMVNEIASRQKDLEVLEAQKERIMASNEENTSAKMATTCEHGQILMTINNLYMKVSQPQNWQIVQHVKIQEGQEY